ncbi:phage major capsid protein [Sphingomonas sp.]|jgi:HK97 family phage major capsid protein|uniref:phage major capsid protein n=1 Tax=Sphingomonas sp. TaxID=28214 RepID=UPI002D7FC379|nr:phage major capsid protein [Sphingomonas sp.]HEU0045086.1 phage major capsid protein [Sphingomonas sp.]
MRKNRLLGGAAALLGPMTAAERKRGRYMRDGEGHPQLQNKTAQQLADEAKAHFDTKWNDVKGLAEEAIGRLDKGELLTPEYKSKIDAALLVMNETKGRMDEAEQKLAKRGSGQPGGEKSIGAQYVESDQFKQAFANGARQGQNVGIEVKAITSLTTDANGSAGDLVRTERVQSPMQELPNRQLTIRNLIAPGQTASSSIEYVQETGFTNNAGMVAEGTLKPESTLKLDLKNAPVRKIAHWFLASAEILADAPGLRSMIDNRLKYGLAFVEDVQLLKGDGTGQNLAGIKPQASDYAVPTGLTGFATPSMIDKLRIAQLQVALALYPADGQVLHPIDWALIEMAKDGEGRYLIGNPQGTLSPTLWGLPVVPSMAQTVGEFTVGAWRMGAQLFDREQSGVLVSTEDGDNFRRNMVTILAEERLALTVYRPEAFVDGAFANA